MDIINEPLGTFSVELLDLEKLTPENSYVLIHVNVGKMPPTLAKKYLKNFKKDVSLCKMLKQKNIQFALIAAREDGVRTLDTEVVDI